MNKDQFVQECIKRVKEANIDDLYLSYIGFDPSKKSGCCPVHGGNNKTGFSYTDKKGYRQYSCWTQGCIGTGKDIIHLCKVKENLSNEYEAVKYLADLYNIELPIIKKTEKQKARFYAKNKLEKFKSEKQIYLKRQIDNAIKNGDIDRAFALELLMDNQITTTEYNNYSKYKANKIYEIDKYISEQNEGLKIAIDEAYQGKKVLIIAPTGSGKTDLTVKTFKDNKYKACFIVPNASNVEQIMNKYDIPGAFGDLGADTQLEKNNIVAFTWDKFAKLKSDLSEDIAIVDEIHQTFTDMYRKDKIKGLYNNLDKCKGRIDITATPNKLDLGIYDVIIEYKQKKQTKYNVNIYNNINDYEIFEIIDKSKKFALLKDDTDYLEFIKKECDKKAEVITSTRKEESPTYFEIVTNGTIGDAEAILNTSVIIAGVNIYDKDITDVIIIGKKDIATIKQYVARFRDLDELNVHIFNTYKDFNKTYELEWLVNKKVAETNELVESINKYNKAQLQDQALGIKMLRLEEGNNFYLDDKTKEYKIDIPSIRNEIYMKYYNNADIVSFKHLLNEYFENVNIVNIDEAQSHELKEFKEDIKLEKDYAMHVLGDNLDIIVGANEIFKGKLSRSLKWYLISNGLNEESILEQLYKNNIDKLLKIKDIKKTIEVYTKYVVENNFTYELAWHLVSLGNRRRGKLFSQLNNLVSKQILDEYPELIDNNLVENRLYNLIVDNFRPGMSYTNEHLEMFIDMINILIPGLKLSITKLGETINNIYSIKNSRPKVDEGHQLDYYFYKNIHPNYCPGKKISINTIIDFRKIDDIVFENKLSDVTHKSLENIIKKRFQAIVESDEAKAILNIEKIFAS